MIRHWSLIAALAVVAFASGCATSLTRLDPGAHEPGWQDTGTPERPSIDRLARYYVDVDGVLWDEHGRRYEEAR